MSLLKALGALLLALPELIKLIENLQREASKIETDLYKSPLGIEFRRDSFGCASEDEQPKVKN